MGARSGARVVMFARELFYVMTVTEEGLDSVSRAYLVGVVLDNTRVAFPIPLFLGLFNRNSAILRARAQSLRAGTGGERQGFSSITVEGPPPKVLERLFGVAAVRPTAWRRCGRTPACSTGCSRTSHGRSAHSDLETAPKSASISIRCARWNGAFRRPKPQPPMRNCPISTGRTACHQVL